MDVQAPQVALSTVIGQLTLNNNEEFGVDYFAKYHDRLVGVSRNNGVFGANNPTVPGGIEPSKLIQFSKIVKNVGAFSSLDRGILCLSSFLMYFLSRQQTHHGLVPLG